MPAVNTSGFNVGVMPQVQFADPRILAPQYQNILPSISQGFTLAGQVQDAPARRQLQQIQLQEAKAKLEMLPVEQQLAAINLGEAQKRAAIPNIIPGDVTLEDQSTVYPAALDDLGERTGPSDTVMGDLVQIKTGQAVGPGGVITPITQRTTLKTAADREAQTAKEAAQLESMKALATQRTRGKDFESTSLIELYNNAVEAGDMEAAQLYKARFDALNTRNPTLTAEDFYDRRVAQLAADAGITYDKAIQLSRTPSGSEALATAATANKAAARSFMPPRVSAEQKAMIRGEEPVVPVADFGANIGAVLGPKAQTPAFSTPEEAAAAFAEGRIKKGDKIIVGGVSGTWK